MIPSLKNAMPNKGFTLIELLVVIAVIGVMATVVMVTINPGEQLARGRDAGKKSTVAQLAKTVQAYYAVNGSYPTATANNNTWLDILLSAGELKTEPPSPGGILCSSIWADNGWCYWTGDTPVNAMVWTRLESKTEKSKCPSSGGYYPVYRWEANNADYAICTVCVTGELARSLSCAQ